MDGGLSLPRNHLDNYYLQIGTPIRTCGQYMYLGEIGIITSLATDYGVHSLLGYQVRFLDGSVSHVFASNLEVLELTDLEKLLYNVESP